MSINVINTNSRKRVATTAGTTRDIITADDGAKELRASIHEVEPNRTLEVSADSKRTHLVYVMEGSGGTFSFKGENYPAKKGTGVYLELGEKAGISAGSTRLVLMHLNVPKHTRKPVSGAATGYYFDEERLQALIDAGRIRIRSFWVNKETGLSNSWDMQAGLMQYLPNAYSPRHRHNPTATNPEGAVHFYMIFEGTATVDDDAGKSLPLGPGDLVLIPAVEWHQLRATDSGLLYMEFQGPFDFKTDMINDPLGKDWYIKGTDDGTGNPIKWVQS
jgi:mannose-6-phosphate isomerase-like protein (cupin superfamily)